MSGIEGIRTIADEILRGSILSIAEPIIYPGLAIVPIIRSNGYGTDIARTTRSTRKAIIMGLPQHSCGAIVLNSKGDVVAFKLHRGIRAFWARLGFIQKLVVNLYEKESEPIGKATALAKAVVFLARLRDAGPGGIMSNSKFDYFAIGFTDIPTQQEAFSNSLGSTAHILYSAVAV
ncbi:MAG: hypothetical protein ACW975_11835 [Candidatus Thorarchaeota archaeon]